MGTGAGWDAPKKRCRKKTQTFNSHFKSILRGVANNFPLNKWDTLLPQAELTCNLLHQSNIAPNVSVKAYTFRTHDFNCMPLVHLGCAVQIHVKMSRFQSWAVNSVDGWYLRTSAKTYRSYDVWVNRIGSVRSTDTVFFKHKHITNPTVTPGEAIVHTAKELTEALKGNVPGSLRDTSLEELARVEQIFAQKAQSHKSMSKVVEQPPRVRE